MFKSVNVVLVKDETFRKENTDRIHEFLTAQLISLKYQVEKLVLTTDDSTIIASKLNELSKQYDVLLVMGDHNIIFKSLAIISGEDLRTIRQIKHKCTYELPSAAKLLTKNEVTYPVIYFQHIFILKEENAKLQFTEILKSHLKRYIEPQIFKKNFQVHTNGNTKTIIDSVKELVVVNVHKQEDSLTLSVSSEHFASVVEVEQMLTNQLNGNFLYSYGDQEALRTVLESSDDHIIKSLEIIDRCLSTYGPDNTFLSFNGGKDCTVLLHLVYALLQVKYPDYKKPIFCLYVQGKEPFPEQEEFISQCQIYYNLDIMVVSSSIKDALQQVLTIKPNLKACFMGTRRTDPYSESLKDFQMTDSDWPQVMRVNPILDWHYSDIWDYILFNKIAYCKLYDFGFTSLGSSTNTVRNPCLAYFDEKLKTQVYLPAYKLMNEREERNGRNLVRL